MKFKKIMMIILLLIVITILVFVVININKKVDSSKDTNKEEIATDTTNNNKTTTSVVSQNPETMVIKDKYFIVQINELYYNIDNYLGRKIELEGFPMSDGEYTFVGRYGPGCCSLDGYVYMEYRYPEKLDLVDEKDWIKVTGTLQKRTEGNVEYVYIKATNVEKLDVRGLDRVLN